MNLLPSGTITFLFTDVEGSTRLLQRLGDSYASLLASLQLLLRDHIELHHGRIIDTQGDSFFVAFPRAKDAVDAVVAAQRAIDAQDWGDDINVRVRMGLHTGEPTIAGERYVGIDVHRAARIGAAGYGGQVLLSETTRSLVQGDLPVGVSLCELGAHRLKDLPAPQTLYQLVIADLPSDFPPLRTLDSVPNNLPRELTPFVGRSLEIVEVLQHLDQTRLLTLTGPGGVGKTRLALEVACRVLDAARFRDGVWWVALGALADPALVQQSVAAALGLRDESGNPLQTLINYVSGKELLLILDDCEHLIAAAAHLADTMLRSAPTLQMLVTSRETLNISGETILRVPSLSLPDLQTAQTPDLLMQNEAVRLFVERAAAASGDFRLTDANASSIGRICVRLDGIPLALELAAARVQALTVEQIADRLDDAFRLLTGGSRTALPRQQTLAATMEWSYHLLTPPERTFLLRLAVFAGGWNIQAAEEICPDPGSAPIALTGLSADSPRVDRRDVLDLLTQLVYKSLVAMDRPARGQARYHFLETIRQFATLRIDPLDKSALYERHCDWFTLFAEQAEQHLRGPDQLEWLARLDADHDNLRAALSWSLSARSMDPDRSLRLAGALWLYWDIRGFLEEGRAWCGRALETPPANSPARVRALFGAATFASRLGDQDTARTLRKAALELARELGDLPLIAEATLRQGNNFYLQGDLERAAPLWAESLAMYRKLGSAWGIAHALGAPAEKARADGEYTRAAELYTESLALFRKVGDTREIAGVLGNLAEVVAVRGDYNRAAELAQESLELFRELADKHGIATSLRTLGQSSLAQSDLAAARAHLTESETLFAEIGDRGCRLESTIGVAELLFREEDYAAADRLSYQNLIAARENSGTSEQITALTLLARSALERGDPRQARGHLAEGVGPWKDMVRSPAGIAFIEALAAVLFANNDSRRAAVLLGAAERMRQKSGLPLDPVGRRELETVVNTLANNLDTESIRIAWEEGSTLEIEEIIALVEAAVDAD